MKQQDVMKRQKELLLRLKDMFEKTGVPAILREHEQEDIPTDILTTLHTQMGDNDDELMGEHYFFPVEGEDVPIMYFTSAITITEELPLEIYADISMAAERLNYILPNGLFVIDPTHTTLSYKCTYVLDTTQDIDANQRMLEYEIGVSMNITTSWMDTFLGMEHGTVTYEEFEQMMPV